jgi:hypothetical protein
MADALSRIKSLETQNLEKSEDIQQLADEIQVVRSLTGVNELLEAGASAVLSEPDVETAPYDPRDLEFARDQLEERAVHQCSFATTTSYEVRCTRCGEILAFCDGNLQGQSLGLHDCG